MCVANNSDIKLQTEAMPAEKAICEEIILAKIFTFLLRHKTILHFQPVP